MLATAALFGKLGEETENTFNWFGEKTENIAEGIVGLTEIALTGEILATLFGWKRTNL